MYALDLCGANVGNCVTYRLPSGEERKTEVVTMITHKKNGNVLLRYGKHNAQIELKPLTQIVGVV